MSNRTDLKFFEQILMDSLCKGDWIEFGVFRGETLKMMVEHNSGRVIGVDSFQGMRASSDPRDKKYPKGKLCCPVTDVVKLLPDTILIKGWIPEVLNHLGGYFTFVHLDVDQYQPTLDVLNWCERHVRDGMVVCHDWCPSSNDAEEFPATQAIRNWMGTRPNKVYGPWIVFYL